MAAPVLGIDFGTSNTAAGFYNERGDLLLIPVSEKVYVLPSVVWYSGRGHRLVGQAARQQMIDDPRHTVFGAKRFLGRRYRSPFVHRHKDRFIFDLVETHDGDVGVALYGEAYPLVDVAADVVKRILELGEATLKHRFTRCVLTTPAHFGYSQRRALREAAERAGLAVQAMVNEPTAAAMYYAHKKGGDATVLVFDLGGGTFDATLMAIRGGVVEVLATGGDAFLGGADFDAALVDHLLEKFELQHGVELRQNSVIMQRLLFGAEAAKVTLTREEKTRLRVPCVALKNDAFIDFDFEVTRRELEDCTAPLVEKCVGICEDILSKARLQPKDVDEIVLVGGQTRMPAIQRRLGQIFKTTPEKHIHPELGVAVGAAILGRGQDTLIDVLSVSLGIMAPGLGAKEIVPPNTVVPGVRRVPLEYRPPLGQPLVLGVYEAIDTTSLERDHLGTARVEASWLDQHPGDLVLEARVGQDFALQLFLHAGSARVPLPITPQGQKAVV